MLVAEVFGNITSLKEHITGLYQREIQTGVIEAFRELEISTNPEEESYLQEQIKRAAGDQMKDQKTDQDPLGKNLGKYRILRTSPLTEIPDACCKDCLKYNMSI